jgi:hypothetical protein
LQFDTLQEELSNFFHGQELELFHQFGVAFSFICDCVPHESSVAALAGREIETHKEEFRHCKDNTQKLSTLTDKLSTWIVSGELLITASLNVLAKQILHFGARKVLWTDSTIKQS